MEMHNLAGKPLMIEQQAYQGLRGIRLKGDAHAVSYQAFLDNSSNRQIKLAVQDGIAIIPVKGPLERELSLWGWWLGWSNYASIEAQIKAAVRDGAVRGILLDIDSPGGEVSGLFDLVDAITAARAQKPIWALADDAFSAAYAIAAAADRILTTRTGGVGSIGVIATHYEQARAEEAAGVKYTAIYAGARKNDLSMHEPLTDAGAQALQDEVNRLYGLFVRAVAGNRKLSEDAVRATEAALYFAENAVAAGLADAVLTNSAQALSDFQNDLTKSATGSIPIMTTQQNPAPAADQTAAPAAANPDAVAAYKARVQAITQACQVAGRIDLLAGFLERDVTPEQANAELLKALAARGEPSASVDRTEITSQVLPVKTAAADAGIQPGGNVLMAAVQKQVETMLQNRRRA